MIVTGKYADGTVRDLTPFAAYSVSRRTFSTPEAGSARQAERFNLS